MNKEQTKWDIQYWCNDKDESTVETWLDSLTKEELKSIAKEMKILGLTGNLLRLPHSKSLKNGLFELRERKYGFRIYYTFFKDKIILMLHAGNKKSQKKDIETARLRLKQLIRDDEED